MGRDRSKLAAFALLTGILAVIGYWRLFTQFMAYDDEGLFLWSLSSYCADGGLYDRIDSLYGPGFFTLNHLLHVLCGLNFNHDTGRLLTLGYWCGTVLLCGLFTWKQTGSASAGLAAQALTFLCLITMIREPMHPSGFLTLAVTLAVVAGWLAIIRTQPAVFAGTVALLGAAMALTKINVGAFFLIAAGTWLAINSRAAIRTRAATLLTALACAGVPMLLMRAQWPNPWVVAYVLVFTCGALTLTAALHDARQPEHGIGSWRLGVAVAAAVAMVVIAAASANGTRWAGLWDGVVGVPLKFSRTNYWPLSWPAGVREFAVVQLLVAFVYYFLRGATWLPAAIAALRIAAGGWFFARIPLMFSEATSLQDFCFAYGPSLAWLMAVPLAPASIPPLGRARVWLAWVFIWQTLQAYPVAGSQVGWGSFLWIPLFVAGWHEAVDFWAGYFRLRRPIWQMVAGLTLAGLAAVALWPAARVGCERFTSNEPLDLPGAARLRLDANLTSDFRILHQNIRAHGDTLFTYPHVFSFNVLTGHRPPRSVRGTSEVREQALLQQLETDPRAVVIINPSLIDFFTDQGFPMPEALKRYLTEHFVRAVSVGAYELWIHSSRRVALFSIARFLPATGSDCQKLELTVEALAHPVAVVEFTLLEPRHPVVQRLPLDSTQLWQLSPVSESGTTIAEAIDGHGPVTISRPSRLKLEFVPVHPLPALNKTEIRLLDADGHVVGRLRFAG